MQLLKTVISNRLGSCCEFSSGPMRNSLKPPNTNNRPSRRSVCSRPSAELEHSLLRSRLVPDLRLRFSQLQIALPLSSKKQTKPLREPAFFIRGTASQEPSAQSQSCVQTSSRSRAGPQRGG